MLLQHDQKLRVEREISVERKMKNKELKRLQEAKLKVRKKHFHWQLFKK